MDAKHDEGGLEANDDQALWELLGRARAVESSPYFVRRVLRDLALDAAGAPELSTGGWRAWLRPGWILAGSTAVLVAAFGIFSFSSMPVAPRPSVVRQAIPLTPAHAVPAVPMAPVVPTAVAPVTVPASAVVVAAAPATSAESVAAFQIPADVRPQDVDVIADLDNLVAREETNAWTDNTSRF